MREGGVGSEGISWFGDVECDASIDISSDELSSSSENGRWGFSGLNDITNGVVCGISAEEGEQVCDVCGVSGFDSADSGCDSEESGVGEVGVGSNVGSNSDGFQCPGGDQERLDTLDGVVELSDDRDVGARGNGGSTSSNEEGSQVEDVGLLLISDDIEEGSVVFAGHIGDGLIFDLSQSVGVECSLKIFESQSVLQDIDVIDGGLSLIVNCLIISGDVSEGRSSCVGSSGDGDE